MLTIKDGGRAPAPAPETGKTMTRLKARRPYRHLWLAIATCAILQAGPADGPSVTSPIQGLVNQYCVTCHNQRLKTGGLTLEQLDVAQIPAQAEMWEKVIRKLRSGTMPPAGVRRPDRATYDATASWLEQQIDQAASTHPFAGKPAIHRLNRTEYANAIRDL